MLHPRFEKSNIKDSFTDDPIWYCKYCGVRSFYCECDLNGKLELYERIEALEKEVKKAPIITISEHVPEIVLFGDYSDDDDD